MSQALIEVLVRRPTDRIVMMDVRGELTRSADEVLLPAYDALGSQVDTLVLNLGQVDFIDTLGVAALFQLLGRVRQRKQRLLAYGLSEESQRAFELTYLDEAVAIYAGEEEALAHV